MQSTRLTSLIFILLVAAASVAPGQIPDMPQRPAEEVRTGYIPDVPPDDSGEAPADTAAASTDAVSDSVTGAVGETDGYEPVAGDVTPVFREPRPDIGPITVPEITDPVMRTAAASGDGFLITAEQVESGEDDGRRWLRLDRNVTITRHGATLIGESGIYWEEEQIAIIRGNVHGEDRGSRIACDMLEYFRVEDLAILTGNASYADSAGVLTADRIEIHRREDLAVARGNARALDEESGSDLTAGLIVYDFGRREARASEGPVLRTRFAEEESDTTGIAGSIDTPIDTPIGAVEAARADTASGPDPDVAVLTGSIIELRPREDTVTALGDAVITRGEIRGSGRIIHIDGAGESILLTGQPVVDRATERLSGDEITIYAENDQVSRLVSAGAARLAYELEGSEGKPAESGHVSGDTLTLFFADEKPDLLTVRGGAESGHVMGTDGERNIVTAPEVDVRFSDGRISRATFRGGASGTYWMLAEGERSGADTLAAAVVDTTASPADTTASPVDTTASPPDTTASPPDVIEMALNDTSSAAADSAAAPAGTPLESVIYSAEQLDYYVARNRMLLSGAARAEYKETVLTADRVEFDPDRDLLTAEGNPDLREKEERLVGEALGYDMDARAGSVTDGVTQFEDGIYYGDRIVREEDGTLRAWGGIYTTCWAPTPHYRLEAGRMKVYLDDKVVAKPVVLYVGEIPVFALPFYVFPIRKDRHSGFLIPQIEVGFSGSRGRFVKNFGYYWAPSDYWDLAGWFDYYEQTQWIANLEARYKVRYQLSGSVQSSFMQELLYDKRRWDLKVDHRQEFGRTWTAGVSGDFRSDQAYASDSNQSIQESVNRSLHSQLWLRGRWSSFTTGVTLDRQEQLDQGNISELLPKVEVTASQKPLMEAGSEATGLRSWLSKVSYSWSARGVNDRERSNDGSEVHQGIGGRATVRYSGKLFGWMNLSPRLNLQQNWYDRDKDGNEYPSRFTYDASVSTGTTVYGTFYPGIARVQGVRHLIQPSVSYSWTPDFSDYFDDGSDRFYSFSGFGSTPRERQSVSLSLVNKLQLKLGDGESATKKDDFLSLSMSTAHDFTEDDRPWSDLTSRLDVRPLSNSSLRVNTRHDAYDGDLERTDLTVSLDFKGQPPLVSDMSWEDRITSGTDSPADQLRAELAERSTMDLTTSRPWSASGTFRYSRGEDPGEANYWIDGRLALSLTENWRVNYSLHYDLSETEIASQEYAIYRDMHCWEARFVGRYYNDEWQYYFRINVKALPEIQAESGVKSLGRSVR